MKPAAKSNSCLECDGLIPHERLEQASGRQAEFCSRRCDNRQRNRLLYRQRNNLDPSQWRRDKPAAEKQERFLPWRDVIARATAADPHLGAALLEALNAHRRKNGRSEVTA